MPNNKDAGKAKIKFLRKRRLKSILLRYGVWLAMLVFFSMIAHFISMAIYGNTSGLGAIALGAVLGHIFQECLFE